MQLYVSFERSHLNYISDLENETMVKKSLGLGYTIFEDPTSGNDPGSTMTHSPRINILKDRSLKCQNPRG
jgi:hypothetical protein